MLKILRSASTAARVERTGALRPYKHGASHRQAVLSCLNAASLDSYFQIDGILGASQKVTTISFQVDMANATFMIHGP